MQIYADVSRLPLSVIGSEQGPALGSAIHAAVAAGAYPDVRAAAAAMGSGAQRGVRAGRGRRRRYDELYAEYTRLHDHFGRGGNDVMHRLRRLRARALGETTTVPGTRCEDGGRVSALSDVAGTVDRLRAEVAALHAELARYGLVVWTAGNVSRPGARRDLLVIKPSAASPTTS